MFITWETIVALIVLFATIPIWLPLVLMILGSLALFIAYIVLHVIVIVEDTMDYIREWRENR
jgi:hypothetical protein